LINPGRARILVVPNLGKRESGEEATRGEEDVHGGAGDVNESKH
jgi:hypothetical protein